MLSRARDYSVRTEQSVRRPVPCAISGNDPANSCKKGKIMKKATSIVSVLCVLAVVPAYAASDMMAPKDSVTVTDWYKQTVYNSQNSTVGKVDDVLVSKSGKI